MVQAAAVTAPQASGHKPAWSSPVLSSDAHEDTVPAQDAAGLERYCQLLRRRGVLSDSLGQVRRTPGKPLSPLFCANTQTQLPATQLYL